LIVVSFVSSAAWSATAPLESVVSLFAGVTRMAAAAAVAMVVALGAATVLAIVAADGIE
jgi:hypothetical protein